MAFDRIYGAFQKAGVKITTAGKSTPNSTGTDGYAEAVALLGVDGLTIATAANPIPVAEAASGGGPATGVTASVASSASAVTILAASTAREGATITNDSTAILYLLLGAGTASSSVYTVQMAGTGGGTPAYYEVPYGFTGIITGIWASATGNARVTSFSA